MHKIISSRSGLGDGAGFSLAEVALALSILAVVIGLLIPTVLSVRVAEQGRMTAQQLESVLRNVANFVQANGCVPCPTPALRMGIHNGRGIVRGDTASNPAPCGTCTEAVGGVPFRSLGIAESMARDGYGNWLTYAVDTALTPNFAVIPPTAACTTVNADCDAAAVTNGSRIRGLCSGSISTTNRLQVKIFGSSNNAQAAVLIMSHGANKRGAFVAFPTNGNLRFVFPVSVPACNAFEGLERCNADNDINFVSTLAGNNVDDPFDDQLLYLTRNALVAYLGGGAACTNGGV